MEREKGADLTVELADGRRGVLVESTPVQVLVRFPDGTEEWVETMALTEKAQEDTAYTREIGS